MCDTSGYGEGEVFLDSMMVRTAGNGTLTWEAPPNTSYREAFDDGDLTAGVLTVTHNLGVRYHNVSVYDNSGVKIGEPDAVTDSSTTALTVDLTSFAPLTGTWNVVVGS